MKHGRKQCKDLDDRRFLERLAQAGPEFGDFLPYLGGVRYADLCQEWDADWQLVVTKAEKLHKRGLVDCEDSYCWLTEVGKRWLEER